VFLNQSVSFCKDFFRPTQTLGVVSGIFCNRNFGISSPYEVSIKKFSKFRAKINYCVPSEKLQPTEIATIIRHTFNSCKMKFTFVQSLVQAATKKQKVISNHPLNGKKVISGQQKPRLMTTARTAIRSYLRFFSAYLVKLGKTTFID
jgi:hypothetical protein